MHAKSYTLISEKELEQVINRQPPDNVDYNSGYALVNVLSEDQYSEEHIPDSINIPADKIDEFERRFSKDKEIVVYCASVECNASPKVAERLAELGFVRVYDFESGLSGWKNAGNPVNGVRQSLREVT